MTLDDIKANSKALGLDVSKLTVYEPFVRDFGFGKNRVYRFVYLHDDVEYSYDFMLTPNQIEQAVNPEIIIDFHIEKGLRSLAEKMNGT